MAIAVLTTREVVDADAKKAAISRSAARFGLGACGGDDDDDDDDGSAGK